MPLGTRAGMQRWDVQSAVIMVGGTRRNEAPTTLSVARREQPLQTGTRSGCLGDGPRGECDRLLPRCGKPEVGQDESSWASFYAIEPSPRRSPLEACPRSHRRQMKKIPPHQLQGRIRSASSADPCSGWQHASTAERYCESRPSTNAGPFGSTRRMAFTRRARQQSQKLPSPKSSITATARR